MVIMIRFTYFKDLPVLKPTNKLSSPPKLVGAGPRAGPRSENLVRVFRFTSVGRHKDRPLQEALACNFSLKYTALSTRFGYRFAVDRFIFFICQNTQRLHYIARR